MNSNSCPLNRMTLSDYIPLYTSNYIPGQAHILAISHTYTKHDSQRIPLPSGKIRMANNHSLRVNQAYTWPSSIAMLVQQTVIMVAVQINLKLMELTPCSCTGRIEIYFPKNREPIFQFHLCFQKEK